MAIGIYKIENMINHKVYIGQSRNISERWRAHRTRSQTEDTHLYRSIREYGLENFTFTIIEECLIEELNDKEKYWIRYYDSNNPDKGYNQTIGGQDEVQLKIIVQTVVLLLEKSLLVVKNVLQNIGIKFIIRKRTTLNGKNLKK